MDLRSMRRRIIVLAIIALMALPGTQTGLAGDGGGDAAPNMEPENIQMVDPWEDDFDDSSHIHTAQATEVVSGEVRLQAGETVGMVASEAIAPPVGFRYDLLVVEVSTPGASTVNVSVLNATETSTQVGFVNEPIQGFINFEARQMDLLSVPPSRFPSLRLQADMEAAGADQPALLYWAVHFVAQDLWYDDYLGTAKVLEHRRLSFDGDTVSIDTSIKNRYTVGYADHDAYPPLITNRWADDRNRLEMSVFYPNAAGDDYGNRVGMYAENPEGFVAGDIDKDGYVDLVVGNNRNGNQYTVDSYILWGNDTGRWDVGRRANLETYAGDWPALGDVNGDGYLDVLVCGGGQSTGHVRVWLNPHTRAFGHTHDIELPGYSVNDVKAADLNSDGYDDVVLAENYNDGSNTVSRAYLGGPGGPDTTSDMSYPTGVCHAVDLNDYNQDGHVDIAFACTLPDGGGNDRCRVYMGSKEGPDEDDDFLPDVRSTPRMCVASGDINGDGYPDLVYGRSMQQPRMYVFWASASGFSNNRRDDPRISTSMYENAVIDVDGDSFADAISAGYYQDRLDIYEGGAGFDGQSDNQLGANEPTSVAIGVGPRELDYVWGEFITKPITRPVEQKWDILMIEGDFPEGTEAQVTVLDLGMEPVLGYDGISGPDVDLSAVSIPSFHLRVTLKSTNLLATPRLDSIFVNWMDPDAWREQFYGRAKVDRLQSFDVEDGLLVPDPLLGGAPELVFSQLRSDGSFGMSGVAFRDAGSLDYGSLPPLTFPVAAGQGAVEVGDFDGDGWTDLFFPVYQTSGTNYLSFSPLFMGTAVGWRTTADHNLPSTGARDAVVRDLNGDGFFDVVIANEYDGTTNDVDSSLFWGSASGFNASADVAFDTTGASAVEAVDLNGDARPDLVFANHKDVSSYTVDSMVFFQDATGFCGTAPDALLATKGAMDVAVADLDGDSNLDLVFANSRDSAFAEIDSYVYWGVAGGGFDFTPAALPTAGARAVAVADLNGDSNLDLVFACHNDDVPDYLIDSLVYLGSGTRSFGTSPDVGLPTIGASGVAVADLDGVGWKDLLFTSEYNGASYEVPSLVYMGGTGGYGTTSDIDLPTNGATDVEVANVLSRSGAGYMSRSITPRDPDNTGVFHTFRYKATVTGSRGGTIQILDANTWEELDSTTVLDGEHEWDLSQSFRVREHRSIRVVVTGSGLDKAGTFSVDELWVNWSERARAPPEVVDLAVSEDSVYRTKELRLYLNISDEYDYEDELTVRVQLWLNGSAETWNEYMLSGLSFQGDGWTARIAPRVDVSTGLYDIRVRVVDSDDMDSGWVYFRNQFEVLNNLPSAPLVTIDPARPTVLTSLTARIVTSALDIESSLVEYTYQWYLDGELVENMTTTKVSSVFLVKGQNWSVEVRADDGEDLGPVAVAYRVVQNAAPVKGEELEDPLLEEDTPDDRWLVKDGFADPDGDILTYRVEPEPLHLDISIDQATGRLTITPEENWNGAETVVVWASDGEFDVNQTMTVTVTGVNDPPSYSSVRVNGVTRTGDHIIIDLKQGDNLTVEVVAFDVEGDVIQFSVNPPKVTLDTTTGTFTYSPENKDVGELNITLSLFDNVSPGTKTPLNFTIRIANVNDPPDDPRIISPKPGETYKWNESFSLIGVALDPDEQWGQSLTFTWESNISGPLGEGTSVLVRLTDSGLHEIKLTVSDGTISKETTVLITVKDRPETNGNGGGGGGDKDEFPMGLALGALVIVIIVVVLVLVVMRRRSEEPFPPPPPEEAEAEERRKALREFADAVEETRKEWEADRDADRAAAEDKSIEVAGTGMVPTSEGGHKMKLSEESSDETAKLWASMEKGAPEVDEAEKEALRKENLKRKCISAIQALPYGIPSPTLRHIQPQVLAEELVEGKKHSLPDGRELTAIRGKWYHSDMEDSSSFLMEYKEAKKGEASGGGGGEWEEG